MSVIFFKSFFIFFYGSIKNLENVVCISQIYYALLIFRIQLYIFISENKYYNLQSLIVEIPHRYVVLEVVHTCVVFVVDLVELTTVEGVFERHGYPASRDAYVDAPGLYSILLDIFVLTRNTDATRNIDKEQAAELLLNVVADDVCVFHFSFFLRLFQICVQIFHFYRYFKKCEILSNDTKRRRV